jgi:hypothetical protein
MSIQIEFKAGKDLSMSIPIEFKADEKKQTWLAYLTPSAPPEAYIGAILHIKLNNSNSTTKQGIQIQPCTKSRTVDEMVD